MEKFEEITREDEIMNLNFSLKILQVTKILNGLLNQFLSKNYQRKLGVVDFEKMVLYALMWGVAGSYEQP